MLALAKVGNEDVGALGPLVTRVFGDWSIAADKQSAAMDYMRAVSQQTGTTVAKLAETVVYAGAPLRLLGYNFEQAAALIGKFEQEGVNTELVLGGMKAALQKFAKEGIADPAAEWQKFVEGVKSGAVTMSEVIQEVGSKRGPDLYKAITEGRLETVKMIEQLQRMAKDGGASVTTLPGEFTKLKHNIEISLGAPTLGWIQNVKAAYEDLKHWHDDIFAVDAATAKKYGNTTNMTPDPRPPPTVPARK
jgi:phage-related minor tail protein